MAGRAQATHAGRDPRIEAPSDCTRCGTCCFSELPEYIRVFGIDWDRLDDRAKSFADYRGDACYMRIENGRCAALAIDPVAKTFKCSIYEMRPDVCRSLERGSGQCLGEIATKAERPLIALRDLLSKRSV